MLNTIQKEVDMNRGLISKKTNTHLVEIFGTKTNTGNKSQQHNFVFHGLRVVLKLEQENFLVLKFEIDKCQAS